MRMCTAELPNDLEDVLTVYQVQLDIMAGRFPLHPDDAVELAAVLCQLEWGDAASCEVWRREGGYGSLGARDGQLKPPLHSTGSGRVDSGGKEKVFAREGQWAAFPMQAFVWDSFQSSFPFLTLSKKGACQDLRPVGGWPGGQNGQAGGVGRGGAGRAAAGPLEIAAQV